MLGRDIEARKAAGLVDDAGYWSQKHAREDEVRRLQQSLERAGFANNPLGFILATPCLLAMINYEDLSGETEQQNLPGSTWQHPNWRRKWSGTVEEMAPLAKRFRELVKSSGRAWNTPVARAATPAESRFVSTLLRRLQEESARLPTQQAWRLAPPTVGGSIKTSAADS